MRGRPATLRLGLVGALLVLVGGCVSAITQPTAADLPRAQARWPAATLAELQEGRTLYVQKCAGCHHLYVPGAYSPDRWLGLVPEMQERAKLDDGQAERIARYLASVSQRRPEDDPPDVHEASQGPQAASGAVFAGRR